MRIGGILLLLVVRADQFELNNERARDELEKMGKSRMIMRNFKINLK